MTYSEKLKDPRWQRKRLEILQRDDFTCKKCGDKESTLHVHHRRYLGNRDPWDYDESLLVTLCENCHEQEGTSALSNQKDLIESLQEAGVYNADMSELGSAIFSSIKNLGKENFDFLVQWIGKSFSLGDKILKVLEEERKFLDEHPGITKKV